MPEILLSKLIYFNESWYLQMNFIKTDSLVSKCAPCFDARHVRTYIKEL